MHRQSGVWDVPATPALSVRYGEHRKHGSFRPKAPAIAAPPMLFFGCHHVVYLQGLRAGTLRIAEDMELRHVQALDKLISLPEILLRLSTGTHNHVYPYKGIGHHFLYLLYLRGKQGGIVTASHQLQHLVTARLQRYMEMRHETPGTGHVFYDFICQQIRLDGGYAVTLNAFHLVQRLHQVEESLTGRLAEVSDIDAGNTISFPPSAAAWLACSTIEAMLPLRLRPRAKGMVQ